MEQIIRTATVQDAPRIREIYAPYVEHGIQTFETEVPDVADMEQRILQTTQQFPWIVISQDNLIIGFAYAHAFRERAGFRYSAESSIYLDPKFYKGGLGKKLYSVLIYFLQLQGYHTLVATVSSPNRASEEFHKKMGFHLQGRIENIGYKLERYIGLSYYVKELLPCEPPDPTGPIPFARFSFQKTQSIIQYVLENLK